MKKILIVDDDAALRTGLAVRLGSHGFGVVFASDAALAVQVARREAPDLILLDIGLPAGDGFLVMQRLQQLGPLAAIPIVVITARPKEVNREKALQAGARAFLQKPIDNALLIATIQTTLGMVA